MMVTQKYPIRLDDADREVVELPVQDVPAVRRPRP
jgi:hypothetical protein